MNQLKQNLISQLLMTNDFESWNCFEPKYFGADTRSVPFFNEVSHETALLLISQLKHLEELDPEKPITITEAEDIFHLKAFFHVLNKNLFPRFRQQFLGRFCISQFGSLLFSIYVERF